MLLVDNRTLNSWEKFKDSDIYFSFIKSPTAIVSSIILLIIFFCSFFVEFVTPHNPFDPASLSLMEAFTPPSWTDEGMAKFILGTDGQGRDMLSTILYGSRISLIVGFSGFIIYPLRKTNVMTIPEYYEIRFGKNVRILGAIILAVGGILNMGLFLKVGSMFIVGIMGLSPSGLMLPIIMTSLLVLALIYTTLGGMFSVIITDYIQFVILSVVLLFTTYFSIYHLGWNNIWDTVYIQMGESGFNPFIEGEFGIEYIIWMIITAGLVSCAIWPTAIARALSMKNAADVKTQYKWSSISFLIRFLIPYFWGICAFVYFINSDQNGKLFFGKESINNLYALPMFLSQIIPAGFIGLLTAGMISAFMSTHDSYLLCWSSVITQDIIVPIKNNKFNDKDRIKWTRIIIVCIGIYILYWGLFYTGSEDVWDYMAITGSIYFTGAISLLIGGLYWKKASSMGATLALLGGMFSIFGLGPIQTFFGISISFSVLTSAIFKSMPLVDFFKSSSVSINF